MQLGHILFGLLKAIRGKPKATPAGKPKSQPAVTVAAPNRGPVWWFDLPDGERTAHRAMTKSEARAKAKKALGLPRLPVGTKIERDNRLVKAAA